MLESVGFGCNASAMRTLARSKVEHLSATVVLSVVVSAATAARASYLADRLGIDAGDVLTASIVAWTLREEASLAREARLEVERLLTELAQRGDVDAILKLRDLQAFSVNAR
jgi:hypothetical protein